MPFNISSKNIFTRVTSGSCPDRRQESRDSSLIQSAGARSDSIETYSIWAVQIGAATAGRMAGTLHCRGESDDWNINLKVINVKISHSQSSRASKSHSQSRHEQLDVSILRPRFHPCIEQSCSDS